MHSKIIDIINNGEFNLSQNKEIEKIKDKISLEEREHLTLLELCGTITKYGILMSPDNYNRYIDYSNKLIKKYQ